MANVIPTSHEEERSPVQVTTVGLDLAKNLIDRSTAKIDEKRMSNSRLFIFAACSEVPLEKTKMNFVKV